MTTGCEVLLCEDQSSGGIQIVTLALEAGQTVLVVMDGFWFDTAGIHIQEHKDCLACSETSWDPTPDMPLCGPSAPVHEAMATCMCSGPCAAPCQSWCGGMGGDSLACDTCMHDTESGCGDELLACQDDV